MAAMAGGAFSGLARKSQIVLAPTMLDLDPRYPIEMLIGSIVAIANDIADQGKPRDTTIVNMSWGVARKWSEPWFWATLRKF